MLWKLDDLKAFTLRATDGEIGEVEQMYFSDENWVVRYLVVRTGGWLDRESVLISPLALEVPNGPARAIPASLSQEQIQNAPNAETRTTVSRENEVKYHDYYGWPYYWVGGPMWGPFLTPGELARAQLRRVPVPEAGAAPKKDSGWSEPSHLRSTKEVEGYRFEGVDGELGYVADFVIDDRDWTVRYLVIDTRKWWPSGKKVVLPRVLVKEVSWDGQSVTSRVTRETVRTSPELDQDSPIPARFEAALAEHYGLPEPIGAP